MSRKPKTAPPKKARGGMAALGGMNLAGLGLMDIDSFNFDDGDAEDIDDGDLEAELNALMSGKRQKKREDSRQKAAPMDLKTIQAMASSVINENFDDNDSDLEGIENDDELLAELEELNEGADETPEPVATRPADVPIQQGPPTTKNNPSPVEITDVLEDRLKNYRMAEEAAKKLGDNSKVRRFARSIKTLEGQLKQAQLGKAIPEDDIPPPVAMPKPKPPPRPADEEGAGDSLEASNSTEEQPAARVPPAIPSRSGTFPPADISDLLGGFDENSTEIDQPPLLPERAGPPRPARAAPGPPQRTAPQPPTSVPERAIAPGPSQGAHSVLTTRRDEYRKAALAAKHSGNMELALKHMRIAKQLDAELQASQEGKDIDLSQLPPPPGDSAPSTSANSQEAQQDIDNFISTNSSTDPSLYHAPEQAETVLGALEQRLAKYKETESAAKEKGDARKVRRLGRIIKDYEDAIKAHKAGKPVNFDELTPPPGFGPIPTATPAPPPAQPRKSEEPPQPEVRPRTSGQGAAPGSNPSPSKPPVKRQMSTTMEKQRQFLLERQRLFKEAAKEALKTDASKEQAKEYLRIMKGIQPMLQATDSGLPVDLNSIPVPPQLQKDFEIINREDCEYELSGDSQELYRTLERELETQFKTCTTNKEHFFKLGDVSSGTKFEKLGQDTQKDLNVLKVCWKRGDPMPKFRYEDRVFTIVRHNHDVADNIMQVSVLRGITLPGKANDLATYVKVDFAYPTDAPQSQKSPGPKNTANPEYNFTCGFEISRKSRTFLRALKRVQLKVEVWTKRGFLRADALLGTASIKLSDLETKCEIHEAFPLLNGRRDTGGKLEVKIRVSEPFTAKQIEEIKERWLIIG